MGATLYVLRQPPELISSSIFRAIDADMDIVFIEQTALVVPSSVKGIVVAPEGMVGESSHPTMTYDDFVEKIFSSEHIIVV